jgi:hypothetical protein
LSITQKIRHAPVVVYSPPKSAYIDNVRNDRYGGNRLFPRKYLHFDNPAQFVRINFVRIRPRQARHLCRNLLQLTGVGDDDLLHPMTK